MMKKMEENLEQEKQRQLSHLDEEIKRRRERKERKRRKQLEEEEAKAVKDDDDNERQQMHEIRQKQAEQLQQQLQHAARPSTPIHKGPQLLSGDDEQKYAEQTVVDLQLSDRDLNQLLISTPLFGQLTEIHTLLQLQTRKGNEIIEGVTKAVGGDSSPYIDLKDAQWECKGDLLPVKVQDLKPSDFVVYHFGMFVANMICKHSQLPGVSMLIASNLPANNYTHNCYRNSFFYENSKKALYIRKERLESVGEFVLVIVHCLSHIRVGDLANDGNPLFLREFYQVSNVNYNCINQISNVYVSL